MKKEKYVSFVILTLIFVGFSSVLDIEVIPLTAKPKGITLYGLTDQNVLIYSKFTDAFLDKYPQVDNILWLEISDTNKWISAINNPSYSIDILWGRGTTIFDTLAEEGYLSPLNNTELINYIEENISDSIAGSDMIRYEDSDDILWTASSLSSYGFTVNHDNLALYNLAIPETWEDLASPEYFLGTNQQAIGMGDAPETTTNTAIYQIILQKYGWEKGWEILTRMAGNAKIFEDGAGPTRDSVITGVQAVALTIDYYGYSAQIHNPSCEYIIPKNCSRIVANPIAVASSTPNLTMAQEFVKFVLSAEGQAIWLDVAINHLPILYDAFDYARDFNGNDREDLRQAFLKTINSTGVLFNETLSQSIYDIVTFYFQGSLTRSILELYSAWDKLVTAYRDNGALSREEFFSLTQRLSAPKISLHEAVSLQIQYKSNPNIRDSLVVEYSTYAKLNYHEIRNVILNTMTISISSPSNGVIVHGFVIINANINTNNEYTVSYVIFCLYNSTAKMPTLANISTNFKDIQFTWNTTEVDNGIYSLNMTVIDKEGIMYSRIITITVNNIHDLTTSEITPGFLKITILLAILSILAITRKKTD